MRTQDIFIITPENSQQAAALKAFVKALKMKFEVAEKPYGEEFVKKIAKSREQYKKGDFVSAGKEDIKKILGL